MTDSCLTCRFWRADPVCCDPVDPTFGYGRCRIVPPIFVQPILTALLPRPEYGQHVDPDLGTMLLHDASQHPATAAKDWCGSYEAAACSTTAVQQAFAELRVAYAELHALPDDADDHLVEILEQRINQARSMVRAAPSRSAADAACKIRVALAYGDCAAEDALVLYRLKDGEKVGADIVGETLFDVIIELERGL